MDIHHHFKAYFDEDPKNEYRFVCLVCKAKNFKQYSGFYDNMYDHVATDQHWEATPKEERTTITEALEEYELLSHFQMLLLVKF